MQNFKRLFIFCLIFSSFSCASHQVNTLKEKEEVLPQYKQEVSAIYKECLKQEHGAMILCMNEKVKHLGEDINIFTEPGMITVHSDEHGSLEKIDQNNKFPVDADNLSRGKEVFGQYCSVCHGNNGQGRGATPDLTSLETSQKTDDEMFWKITDGSWPMPTFWEGDILSEKDIWTLIYFIRSLSNSEYGK